jgi:16S rRNA (guanine966-N2)-methyltransferase
VVDAVCLDLFAGTGALGIEALSRGAASCTFVDSSPAAARTIRENLDRTGLAGRATVIRADAARSLGRRSGGPYDLAFVDPPYAISPAALRAALEILRDRLAPDARMAVTRPTRSSTDVVPVDWLVERRLAYGDSLVLVCREGP